MTSVPEGEPAGAPLVEAVAAVRGGDPLAPVTVVAPSEHSARAARRELGWSSEDDGRRGVANVDCTTVDGLIRRLAVPLLADRGLRVAPWAVDLEALRACAGASPGWLADLAAHGGGLLALHHACTELRRCPAATVAALGRRSGRAGELARLVVEVGARLHESGFADELDVVRAAEAAGGGAGTRLRGWGPLVCLDLGPVAPGRRRILDLVGARVGHRGVPGDPGARLTEVRSCPDPDEEVRTAVRAVVAAVDRGAAAWRQAVFHPGDAFYGRALHQELAAAGVATQGPGKLRLDRSVAGATLLGLLDLAGSNWRRDEVTAWMSGAPLVDGPGGERVPSRRWDALSAEAGVVAGPSQWAQRLAALGGRDEGRAAEAAALAAFVDGLVAATVEPTPSWAAFAAWAVALLDRYLDDETIRPDLEAAAAAQVRATVLALGELDRVSAGTDAGAFRRMVRAVLHAAPLDTWALPGGADGDGVLVAPLAWGRALRLDGVVVVGLADDLLPGPDDDDALLPEHVRRLDVSGGLRPRRARRAELHDDLRAALASAATRRMATYPRVDPRRGSEHAMSRWLTTLATPTTRWRPVDSFAAAVAAAEPPLSLRELELHDAARWAPGGPDAARAAPAPAGGRLQRALAAARHRGGDGFTRFDGNVGRGRVSPFTADAPVSATRLETYAKCPRRFLVQRVLHVTARTRPEDLWQMEPARRGTLVHAVLEQYLVERLEGAPRSLERLMAVADAHFAAAEDGGSVGKPLLWRMDRAALRRDLRRFYEEEGDLEPLAAELEFGTGADGADPAVTVELGDGRRVHFAGMADRVDRSRTGALVVSDYKTGRQHALADLRRDPVAGGRLLQLPVYASAARARFGGPGPVVARYWLLSEQRAAPSYTVTVTDEVERRFLDVLGLIAGGIEAGLFPGAPTERWGERQFDACRSCDLDRMCPPDRDRQWVRKGGDPALAPVTALAHTAAPGAMAGTVVAGPAGAGGPADPDGAAGSAGAPAGPAGAEVGR
jgi:RecB family exonuclease